MAVLPQSRILSFLTFCAIFPIIFFITDAFVPACFAFKPPKLQEISKRNIAQYGEDIPALMHSLVKDLQAEYGSIVDDYDDAKWVFNVAGGSTVCFARLCRLRLKFC